jgi:hypothetical protein
MLTTRHAPSSIASRATDGAVIVSSSRSACAAAREARVVEQRVGCERLFDAREVERVESAR